MIEPTFTTPFTDELCKRISKRSNGTIFLGLSGGKDSLCAWLSLRRYFKRIIPFHCASWPQTKYITEYLDYLEYEMGGTHILRMLGEDYPMALVRMMYQPLTACEDIESWVLDDYSKLDVLEFLRYKYSLPRAWCAFGISASDSIGRSIYVKQIGGCNKSHRTFYPCADWPKDEILKAVEESGLKLMSSYRYTNRTMGNVPGSITNEILKRHYPQDWEHMKALYPLCEAKTVREEILDREWAKAKQARIEANGGTMAHEQMPPQEGADATEGEEDLSPERMRAEALEGDWLEEE